MGLALKSPTIITSLHLVSTVVKQSSIYVNCSIDHRRGVKKLQKNTSFPLATTKPSKDIDTNCLTGYFGCVILVQVQLRYLYYCLPEEAPLKAGHLEPPVGCLLLVDFTEKKIRNLEGLKQPCA